MATPSASSSKETIPTSSAGPSASQSITVPPLSLEEEDAIIHTRITNDERPLRRVIRKFHTYTAAAHGSALTAATTDAKSARHSNGNGIATEESIEDAREAFLIELASFQLTLKKALMVCEAEARQVEEYERERRRIADEHGTLRGQIEQLKTALEHAHLERRRKIEYDLIAEKINTLPSRDELQQSIGALENDMATIRAEHDFHDRMIHSQKVALEGIVAELSAMRLMGKDKDAASRALSRTATPAIENSNMETDEPENSAPPAAPTQSNANPDSAVEVGELEEKGDGEDKESVDIPLSTSVPTSSSGTQASRARASKSSTPVTSLRQLRSSTAVVQSKKEGEDDIEMGEVEENPKLEFAKGKKKLREELEEGEASDSSSALSDPPDD